MTKRLIHQGDIAILNMMEAPNNRSTKYVKQELIELKGKIDKSTIIIGEFNILLPTIDKTTRHGNRKDTEHHEATAFNQDL